MAEVWQNARRTQFLRDIESRVSRAVRLLHAHDEFVKKMRKERVHPATLETDANAQLTEIDGVLDAVVADLAKVSWVHQPRLSRVDAWFPGLIKFDVVEDDSAGGATITAKYQNDATPFTGIFTVFDVNDWVELYDPQNLSWGGVWKVTARTDTVLTLDGELGATTTAQNTTTLAIELVWR